MHSKAKRRTSLFIYGLRLPADFRRILDQDHPVIDLAGLKLDWPSVDVIPYRKNPIPTAQGGSRRALGTINCRVQSTALGQKRTVAYPCFHYCSTIWEAHLSYEFVISHRLQR